MTRARRSANQRDVIAAAVTMAAPPAPIDVITP
jgi:hypothetical protein